MVGGSKLGSLLATNVWPLETTATLLFMPLFFALTDENGAAHALLDQTF